MAKSKTSKSRRVLREQLKLFDDKQKRYFGGRLLYQKRKALRPLSSREALHFVIRSCWARGEFSFLKPHNKNAIIQIIRAIAKTYGIKLYQVAVASNQCHFIIKFSHRELYKSFARVVTGKIASHVMKNLSFTQFVQRAQSVGVRALEEIHGLEQQFFAAACVAVQLRMPRPIPAVFARAVLGARLQDLPDLREAK